MKYSIQNELLDMDKSIEVDNVSLDHFISRNAKKMLHSIVVSDNEELTYQILFTGDRVIDINKVREHINNSKITVDMRFYPLYRKRKSTIGRIPPLSFKQGIKTIIDESVILNDKVHVASELQNSTNGYWVDVESLIEIYPGSNVINISEEGSSQGGTFSSEGKDLSDERFQSIKSIINEVDGKPILFNSSKKEIGTIIKLSEELVSEDIEEILRLDPCIYMHFLTKYFNGLHGKFNDSPSIKNMIETIGEKESLNILKCISMENNHLNPEDIDISIASSSFKSVPVLSEIIKELIVLCKGKYPDYCEQKGAILGRIAGYQVLVWLSSKGKGKSEYFSQQMKLNPHRFLPEIQKMSSGYNQDEVSSLVLNENNFPDDYQKIIANYNNPAYQDGSCFYAHVIYIVSSIMVEKGLFEINQFTPMGNVHEILMDNLNIRDEVLAAFDKHKVNSDNKRKTDWRFDWPDKEKKENIIHPSYCSF